MDCLLDVLMVLRKVDKARRDAKANVLLVYRSEDASSWMCLQVSSIAAGPGDSS